MWRKRLWETFATITIGDGVRRGVARFFAEDPKYMRLLGLSQIAFGVWLALRQYSDG